MCQVVRGGMSPCKVGRAVCCVCVLWGKVVGLLSFLYRRLF